MEPPSEWDLLTGAIASTPHEEPPESVYEFLVWLGAIESGQRAAFVDAVTAVRREGEITGPSQALRIAGRMRVAERGKLKDPFGHRAARLWTFWRKGAFTEPSDDSLRWHLPAIACGKCGLRCSPGELLSGPGQLNPCRGCGQRPIELVDLLVEAGLVAPRMVCPACGTGISPSSTFCCWRCGSAV